MPEGSTITVLGSVTLSDRIAQTENSRLRLNRTGKKPSHEGVSQDLHDFHCTFLRYRPWSTRFSYA